MECVAFRTDHVGLMSSPGVQPRSPAQECGPDPLQGKGPGSSCGRFLVGERREGRREGGWASRWRPRTGEAERFTADLTLLGTGVNLTLSISESKPPLIVVLAVTLSAC